MKSESGCISFCILSLWRISQSACPHFSKSNWNNRKWEAAGFFTQGQCCLVVERKLLKNPFPVLFFFGDWCSALSKEGDLWTEAHLRHKGLKYLEGSRKKLTLCGIKRPIHIKKKKILFQIFALSSAGKGHSPIVSSFLQTKNDSELCRRSLLQECYPRPSGTRCLFCKYFFEKWQRNIVKLIQY